MPIPNEATPDIVPTRSFDPVEYCIENKNQVLLFVGLLAAVIVAYGAYEISAERTQAAARRMFAEAKTADEFRKVAQDYPKTVVAGDARLMLAGQLRDEKKYDEAVAMLRAFIADSPQHPLISSAWLSLAETLEAAGKADEALETYQLAATKFPDSYAAPMALLARGVLLVSKGKKDEARRVFESIPAQFPDSITAREVMREIQSLKK